MNAKFKRFLEFMIGKELSDNGYKEIMKMTTDDIKFNRVGFKKKTRIEDLTEVAIRCAVVFAGLK